MAGDESFTSGVPFSVRDGQNRTRPSGSYCPPSTPSVPDRTGQGPGLVVVKCFVNAQGRNGGLTLGPFLS